MVCLLSGGIIYEGYAYDAGNRGRLVCSEPVHPPPSWRLHLNDRYLLPRGPGEEKDGKRPRIGQVILEINNGISGKTPFPLPRRLFQRHQVTIRIKAPQLFHAERLLLQRVENFQPFIVKGIGNVLDFFDPETEGHPHPFRVFGEAFMQ